MVAGRQGGATTLLLEVRPSNTRALDLYRHFGFQQIGIRRAYYPADKGREDALVLTHLLVDSSA
jgi:ribosomal-protein-alanine N-acetyltransferase